MSATPDLYIGIMSGTSLDGIDAALVDLSQPSPRLVSSHFQPYAQPMKEALLALHHASHDELHQSQLIANQLAREYADATQMLLEKSGVSAKSVQAVGCHGQTVRHRPEHGYTIQLNNAALLAELTGIHVVSDFRSRDIAAGGQGAPLVPAFHDKVLRHPRIHRAVLNIGGIANLTDLALHKITIGFDSGPGNLLMDAWMAKHQGKPYDKDGAWAASGTVIPALLQHLLSESYFVSAPPKSTGRDLFNLAWLEKRLNGKEAPADVQATLLALTGDSIVAAVQRFCRGTKEIYLCGGGAHNLALVAHLQRSLPECRIQKTEVLGIAADLMEAIAFAWLEKHLNGKESPADVQATLLALTGDSIVAAVQRFCRGTKEIYLCGGGAHNLALVAHLQRSLPECRIQKTEVLGIAADWMEAMAFAWLAQQTMHLRPGNLPAVTGAKHPCVLGAIYPA